MRTIELKVIPGDGIGIEVINEAKIVLKELAQLHGGIQFHCDEYDWSCEYYLKHGEMMPKDGLRILEQCDSIVLGAVGFPGVPDHISLRGLLLPIRMGFDQYINFRPIQLLPGLKSPLIVNSPGDIDFVCIRENTEGEYCGKGYYKNENTPEEIAVQEAWFSRKGTHRVIKYAFEYARKNGLRSVVSGTKSNSLNYSMVFWDKIFNEIKEDYKEIDARSILIDALSGFFILKPQMFDVVVASNLFGDILTDLGSAMLGSIGISPSGNINPEKTFPSMFEPVHGSAPDIAGKGIANPIATFWALVLMLEHLGLQDMSVLLMNAMKGCIQDGIVTPDLGGTYTTSQVTRELCLRLMKHQ
jgi:tartrate dehydrogenase/decarboxylase / D-malate dehydrogenase